MDSFKFKLILALLRKTPLMARVVLLHVLRLSEQSKYVNLRMELIVALLRSFVVPSRPRSISSTQRILTQDPGVKGRMWVSTSVTPISPEKNSIREAMAQAIRSLCEPGNAGPELRIPDMVCVEGEWTGYRAEANSKSLPPAISEKQKFVEMMKEVTSPVTILYFHGGAYWLMDPSSHRQLCKKLAKLTGGRCFSVRYRLAPQNPFPSALMDGLVSYLSLLYPPPNAFHEAVRPGDIVFAGDSAGGNLSLALLQLLLEFRRSKIQLAWHGASRDIPLPAGVAVNSPWVDLTASSHSARSAPFDYLPSADMIRSLEANRPPCPLWPTNPPRNHVFVDDVYLDHPLVSLVMARSWAGAPPVYICTGWELLGDEDRFMAWRLQSEKVRVVCEEYEAMPHCFALIFPDQPGARRCVEGWAGFITRVVVEGPETVEGRFVRVKANTLEEVKLEVGELTDYTEDDFGQRVKRQIKAVSKARECVSKL